MEKAPKQKRTFSADATRSMGGFSLLLFGLLIGLSPFTHLKFIAYCVDWAFGYIGLYSLSFLLVWVGFKRLFHKKIKAKPNPFFITGLILLFVFAVLLGSFVGNYGTKFEFAQYSEAMQKGMLYVKQGGQFGKLGYDPILCGGALGFLLTGLFVSVGNWLAILLLVFLFLFVSLFLFWPCWEKLGKNISSSLAIAKARRSEKREKQNATPSEPSDSFNWNQSDEEPILAPEKPIWNGPEPQNSESPSLAEEPSLECPTHPTFVRASSAPITETRREHLEAMKAQQFTEPAPQVESTPFSFVPSSGGELRRALFPGTSPSPSQAPSNVSPSPVVAPSPAPSPAISTSPMVPDSVQEETIEENSFVPSFQQERIVGPETVQEKEVVDIAPTPIQKPAPAKRRVVAEPTPAPVQVQTTIEEVPARSPVVAFSLPAPTQNPSNPDIPDAAPLPPYEMPGLDLINPPTAEDTSLIQKVNQECQDKIQKINQLFMDMGVGASVAGFTVGPSITMYELNPEHNVSISSINKVIPDLEVRLGGVCVRFSERVLGTTHCAIEVPNDTKRSVLFYEVYTKLSRKAPLQIPFGVDIRGEVIQGDLAEFPHMLVAGTTGSGKSIFMHGVLCSLIMHNRPEELKLLLIDPKRVEMSKYRNIPHLLCPIVKEPREALVALKKLVDEMERRYRILEECDVRDITSFNNDYAPENHKAKMPYIVCVIDEFANLVTNYKEVIQPVLDLSGKARSCGIHLIVATQRPDVKIIPGSIKNNITTRVALSVSSTEDSMTILGQGGAEDLLGKGDMLVDCGQVSRHGFVRCQGCFLSDKEIKHICDFLAAQQPQCFDSNFLDLSDHEDDEVDEDGSYGVPGNVSNGNGGGGSSNEQDLGNLYQRIKDYVVTQDTMSISRLQNEFGMGYPRAQKIFKQLKRDGIVGETDSRNNSKGAPVIVASSATAPEPDEPKDMLNIHVESLEKE